MSVADIPLDKAELLSVLLEAILYGFSLLMFAATIWVLLFRRSSDRVNRKMLAAAYALLVLSTIHLVIHITRVMEGLIIYADTYPGGPVAFFADTSQWTFVSENYVYTAQSLVGDAVVLYRCYSVWQSKFVMILPVLLWCATVVTGIMSPYMASRVAQDKVFSGTLGKWIASFWAMAFVTNLLTTTLLAFRIWYVGRRGARLRGHRDSPLRPVLHIIIDAGAIYSLTLLAALICFASKTNGQYVTLDMVPPIISITFYMVIIRVGLANRTNQPSNIFPLGHTSSGNSTSANRRGGVEIRIATITENRVENDPRTSKTRMRPISEDSERKETTLGDAIVAV